MVTYDLFMSVISNGIGFKVGFNQFGLDLRNSSTFTYQNRFYNVLKNKCSQSKRERFTIWSKYKLKPEGDMYKKTKPFLKLKVKKLPKKSIVHEVTGLGAMTYEERMRRGLYTPLRFTTPEELKAKIEEFLKYVEKKAVPMTIARLAVFLECTNGTINAYSKRWMFAPLINNIRQVILADKEERLNGSTGTKAGIVFDLINNHSYRNYAPIAATDDNNDPANVANQIQAFVKKAQMVCIPPEGATLGDFDSPEIREQKEKEDNYEYEEYYQPREE